jgi:hypothetical protein
MPPKKSDKKTDKNSAAPKKGDKNKDDDSKDSKVQNLGRMANVR